MAVDEIALAKLAPPCPPPGHDFHMGRTTGGDENLTGRELHIIDSLADPRRTEPVEALGKTRGENGRHVLGYDRRRTIGRKG